MSILWVHEYKIICISIIRFFYFSDIEKNDNLISLHMHLRGDDSDIYLKKIVDAPMWYHAVAISLLAMLSIFGVLLNGFIICCFISCPIVSFTLST